MTIVSLDQPLTPGQVVFYGRYTLVRPLGRGGMGTVWLALDQELGVHRALKFITGVFDEPDSGMVKLRNEAMRMQGLTHEHIVRIYDFVKDSELAALSMEYIDGVTLKQLQAYQPGHCFDVSDLGTWISQLCRAMAYAHAHDIVHLDLKPANLMINSRGQLKVTDFGISQPLGQKGTQGEAFASGTPSFMSPQQLARQASRVEDDIYSFGATLFALFSGRSLTFKDLRSLPAIQSVRAELGSSGKAPIPVHWEATIQACLSPHPGDRPRSFTDVAKWLGLEGPLLSMEGGSPSVDTRILQVQHQLKKQSPAAILMDEEDLLEKTVLIVPEKERVRRLVRPLMTAAATIMCLTTVALAKLGHILPVRTDSKLQVKALSDADSNQDRFSLDELARVNTSINSLASLGELDSDDCERIAFFIGADFDEAIGPLVEHGKEHPEELTSVTQIADVLVSRARLQFRFDRMEQALSNLDEALEIVPCYEPALFLRDRLLEGKRVVDPPIHDSSCIG